ncbi:MAG: hypothetical protein GX053_12705 [Tissierella sp.]|nr:hypothetical protein [Tissierella sp.]
MDKENNLKLYNEVRIVPETAKKPIQGGRLKGMTDINPMWRIKVLTEQFGPCGVGWYYDIVDKRIEQGGNDELVAFVDINLYVKIGQEWSKPISGTGGSSFVTKESRGLYTSDECFKMALTDAISVSCKALGIGADVYFEKDRSKYDNPTSEPSGNQKQKPKGGEVKFYCSDCGVEVNQAVHSFSTKKFGRCLCMNCQKKAK